MTLIDAPRLDDFHIAFFDNINFDTPRLYQFISRTPRFMARDKARVQFDKRSASVALLDGSRILEIEISCWDPTSQLLDIAKVCSFLPPVSTVEVLYIEYYYSDLDSGREDDAIEDALWFNLLLPFSAVKTLHLSRELAPDIAAALRELPEVRTTEVLPRLEDISVEELEPSGPLQKDIGQFVAARSLSDHPITISVWDKR